MGGYEVLMKRIWADAHFRNLPNDSKLLFIWAWTNEDAAVGGLYPVSVKTIMKELQLPRPQVKLRLADLGRRPLILYDEPVIWVYNRAKYTATTDKRCYKIWKEYNACPPNPLKTRFANRYRDALRIGRTVAK